MVFAEAADTWVRLQTSSRNRAKNRTFCP